MSTHAGDHHFRAPDVVEVLERVTAPTAAPPPRPAAIVQRDDGFVIVATDTIAKPAVVAPLAIGRAGRGKVEQTRACTVEREVRVADVSADDIIARVAGGYATLAPTPDTRFFQLGSPADNNLKGNCRLFDFRMTLRVREETGWQVTLMDLDRRPDLGARFGVSVTPTTMVIRRGSAQRMVIATGVEAYPGLAQTAYQAVKLLTGDIRPQQFLTGAGEEGGFFDALANGPVSAGDAMHRSDGTEGER